MGFVCVVKGVRELLQACLELTNRRIQLDVIGKVNNHVLHRELELLAAQAGKTNWLRFHGPVNHSEVLRRHPCRRHARLAQPRRKRARGGP